jgi:predicted dehydrogenase
MNDFRPTRRALMTAALIPAAAVRGSAANSEITVGLIGCGGRGTYDATLLVKEVPGARLTAVADIFPDRVEKAKKSTGVSGLKTYPSGNDLLSSSGVDAVIIATPVFLHPEHLEAAIKAGKHIYIEKPAGADVAGVKRLMRTADAAPRNLDITFGFQQRYGPGYRKAKALVDGGGIGRVVAAHAYWVKYQVTQNPPKTRPVTDIEKVKQWHEWR